MKCPKCQANWKQYKAGFNPSGASVIDVVNVTESTHPHHPNMGIQKKLACSQFACMWKANPQSVVNWVNQYTAKLPNAPMPRE